MPPNDIYNSKEKYERFIEVYVKNRTIVEPVIPKKKKGSRLYYCKNPENLKYYQELIKSFELDDISYIRRLRLLSVLNMLTFFIECDLKNASKTEIEIVTLELRARISYSQLGKTVRDIRRIGRILFGEELMPLFFKAIKIKVDISRQVARKDKLTIEEFDRLMKFFSNDPTMQAYLAISFECLVRPQELLYVRIQDVDLVDNYAFICVSEHGKEGTKKLLSIDSYPYLIRLLGQHSNRNNPNAFLFINSYGDQLTPYLINKRIKLACKRLNIAKPICCYSLKRSGVTYRRLKGDDILTIQRTAGWRSPRQLATYDLSDQDDVFKLELAKRGLLKGAEVKKYQTYQSKPCNFCGELIGFAETVCPKCQHILDRTMIEERIKCDQELIEFINGIKELRTTEPGVFKALQDLGRRKGII